jgi:hypothetical protein
MPGLPWCLAHAEDLVDVPVAATVPVVPVPVVPAVTMHAVGIEIDDAVIVAMPAIAVSVGVAGGGQGCRTKRGSGGEGEQ